MSGEGAANAVPSSLQGSHQPSFDEERPINSHQPSFDEERPINSKFHGIHASKFHAMSSFPSALFSCFPLSYPLAFYQMLHPIQQLCQQQHIHTEAIHTEAGKAHAEMCLRASDEAHENKKQREAGGEHGRKEKIENQQDENLQGSGSHDGFKQLAKTSAGGAAAHTWSSGEVQAWLLMIDAQAGHHKVSEEAKRDQGSHCHVTVTLSNTRFVRETPPHHLLSRNS